MEIPEEATQITMCYNLWHTIYLPEDLDRANVKTWWIKYGDLNIEMNDGSVIKISGEVNLESVNWKRGHDDVTWQDEDYNTIAEVPEA